jgi:ABC-type polysaccharide/polyol phosphate export permease
MLLLGGSISWTLLLAIPGFAWLLLNGALAGLFLGVICARFRDLPQIVSNIVQIAFFVSPVMWKSGQLLEQHRNLVDYNPFAAHLIIISDPILGKVPTFGNYMMCLASTVLIAAVALPFFARYRERIVYWL